jgi:hypothetical protein
MSHCDIAVHVDITLIDVLIEFSVVVGRGCFSLLGYENNGFKLRLRDHISGGSNISSVKININHSSIPWIQ